jgi:hypothetical protein
MTDEEEKYHRENDVWIARWEDLQLARKELSQTTLSRIYIERKADFDKLETELAVQFEQFSTDRQDLLRQLKAAVAERNEENYWSIQRLEKIATAVLPVVMRDDTLGPADYAQRALDIASALIIELEKEL